MKVPQEVLIKIFAMATRSRGSAASWILYQWRSKGWFEKQLYERVLLRDEETASLFVQCLRRRDMHEEFAKTSVKSLSLSGDVQVSTIIDILCLCTGINHLSLIPDHDDFQSDIAPLLQLLDTLPLKVLSLQVAVQLTSPSISNVTFFAKLTHLEIDPSDMLQHADMACFPQLTHLSLWSSFHHPRDRIPSLVKRILCHPTLQVLIFRVTYHRNLAKFLDDNMLNDPRIVLAPPKVYLWDDLGRSSMLLWELAEERVASAEPNHSSSILSIMATFTNYTIQTTIAALQGPCSRTESWIV
ncbi:uncharacterized protein EDB91DRAFT_1088616 [Suillus paluster]|uniref:uncharacterized protein n=1 Tax=Suillus paluster TaxID=48578 RepID=UPI001B8726D8|nr:uncharacterized protein EDB91DRAFT_1088616 [Suillus paluster]KAG1720975.1 hypothetical protein EDB91DRAFT_1088616 [Suillus paluster]